MTPVKLADAALGWAWYAASFGFTIRSFFVSDSSWLSWLAVGLICLLIGDARQARSRGVDTDSMAFRAAVFAEVERQRDREAVKEAILRTGRRS